MFFSCPISLSITIDLEMSLNGQKEEKKRVGVAENEFCWKVKVNPFIMSFSK
jgi:hypothetical protein